MIDFEDVSNTLSSAPHVHGNNWHYQAFLVHQNDAEGQLHTQQRDVLDKAEQTAHDDACLRHASPTCVDFYVAWCGDMRTLYRKQGLIQGVAALDDGTLTDAVNQQVWRRFLSYFGEIS